MNQQGCWFGDLENPVIVQCVSCALNPINENVGAKIIRTARLSPDRQNGSGVCWLYNSAPAQRPTGSFTIMIFLIPDRHISWRFIFAFFKTTKGENMKFYLTTFAIILIYLRTTSTATALTFMCYTTPLCANGSTPDSTCDTICNASSCPSGTPSLPAGYTGSISGRKVQTKCNSNGTYSCYCGITSSSNLACASGYTGTAQYEYKNGKDYFSGCSKDQGGSLDPILICEKGSYKSGTTCKPCPADNSVNGTTAGTGATSATECYIAAGTSVKGITGTYTYTNDCYYTSGGLVPLPGGNLTLP